MGQSFKGKPVSSLERTKFEAVHHETLRSLHCHLHRLCDSSPREKTHLDDLAGETGKILVCQGKITEEACKECCGQTVWYVSAEQTACELACNILPNIADYASTTAAN